MFEKKGENGVSTPHVLSMGSYAHAKEKHDKSSIYQNNPNYPFRDLIQSQVSHINQPTCSLSYK